MCLSLGMEYHLLREIEEYRSRSIERLQDSMHTWLSSDKVRPTWARIVTELRLSGKATLAETVERKYCKPVETPPKGSNMSDTPPDEPQLNDLLNALSELSWGEVMEVALRLGVAFRTLRQVEGNSSEFIERLQVSMFYWLSSDKVRPTWARLVTALRVSGKVKLADTVEQKYCKPVETPPACPATQYLSSPHSPPLTEQATLPPPTEPTTTAVSSSVNPLGWLITYLV